MVKKSYSYIKLQISAGMANPAPPIGPVLGQKGINILNFCKSFNDKTKNIEKGLLVTVIITIKPDRSFTFIIKSSPASVLLKKALGIKSGSDKPNKKKIGVIKKKQIYDIAELKYKDMTGINIDSMAKCIIGTAKSMGIIIEE